MMENEREDYRYAGLYATRLFIAETGRIVHINEYLYTEIEEDNRLSGEKAVRLRQPTQPRSTD